MHMQDVNQHGYQASAASFLNTEHTLNTAGKKSVVEIVRFQQHKGEVGLKDVPMSCPKNSQHARNWYKADTL